MFNSHALSNNKSSNPTKLVVYTCGHKSEKLLGICNWTSGSFSTPQWHRLEAEAMATDFRSVKLPFTSDSIVVDPENSLRTSYCCDIMA